MKRLLFIYNPRAGRMKVKGMLSELLDVFARQGFEITAHPTLGPGDATEAALLSTGYDRVVCCGGDGTLNETVTGLLTIPKDQRPPLGYVPTGSTNDFSRNLNLPKATDKLAETACTGVLRAVDLGDCSGRLFTYVSAFGLFTDVTYTTPQNTKNLLGHFAYLLEGAGRLVSIPSYHMTVEDDSGRHIEGDFIYGMVSNTISVGGLLNLPRDMVRLDDGQFEVVLVRPPHSPKDWQSILAALAAHQFGDTGAVTSFSAHEVVFHADHPVAWTVDGEFGGEQAETVVKNLPLALTIACGK